ncbi:MAG: bacterioferritin-associated ferredoxin [Panacagrimonas sp.]
MYICICKAVSDKRIRRAVANGACTVRDLARETGLGSGCGKCVPAAREVLAASLNDGAPIPLSQLSVAGAAVSA